MAAEWAVIEIELVPDLVVYGLRNANGTRRSQGLEPGSDVDAVAKDVITVNDHVTKIDADPQLETALRRDRIVDRPRRPLHLDGAIQRVNDARKIRQQAVARGAYDPPTVG